MIKLKSGKIIEVEEDFDQFFQTIMTEIISESVTAAQTGSDKVKGQDAFNKILLKEIMDNSIFVTHQIFDLAKVNKNLSKFLVTGFLFNSIVLSIPDLSNQFLDTDKTIH
ncbi:MAG: hypothetical protein PF637_08695 [Spirochaetes bacterium]|jgi:hypothetical protein|nr:hypothetical protein [Spirochaetota bacterium]